MYFTYILYCRYYIIIQLTTLVNCVTIEFIFLWALLIADSLSF